MRPAGEVRKALLTAATSLAQPGVRGATLRELAAQACVGYDAALSTVKHMTRAGELKVARERKVDYRNKPVAEYEPVVPGEQAASSGFVDLGTLLGVWAR
jgi:hypothetical protein